MADTGHNRIAEYSRSGRLVATFGQNLDQPAGIATDATGHVWVADTGHDRVVEFSPVGRVLAIFGSPGGGRGQLDQPVALAVTPFGDVWVADQGNSRVEEFSASGHYRTSFAVPTPAGGGLDALGDVWASSPADAPANSVREFSPAGHQLRSFGTTQAGYGDLGDPGGVGGGPVIDDSPAYNNVILSWTTYPERLRRAGLSWQVYQEEDNYDDNALAWFRQFAGASVSSPLWQRGMRKRPAGTFETDARQGRLPQVSWLVAPTAQSEHRDYFPAAGAEYVAGKLDAIASNEDQWHKTLFILTYDENDGLFDHVPPPVASRGTPREYVNGEPIGLGFRVPAVVVSPWSAGGRVCSDVLDHAGPRVAGFR